MGGKQQRVEKTMRMLKHLILLASAAVALATLTTTAAVSQTLADIKSAEKLDVGVLIDTPPIGFMGPDNQPQGYDIDIAKLLAKDLGVELNMVQVSGPNRVPYLLGNRIDVLVAALGITPARAESVDFTQPYASMQVLVFGEKTTEIHTIADLAGKTIGYARGGAFDQVITPMAPEGTNIQRFDDDASSVQALLSGQVELIGSMNTIAPEVQKQAPGRFETKLVVANNPLGIAIRKGNPELLAYLNDFVQRTKAGGQLNALHEKWFGAPLPDLSDL
jgi:polar amino acid transport system substrate-binding protein